MDDNTKLSETIYSFAKTIEKKKFDIILERLKHYRLDAEEIMKTKSRFPLITIEKHPDNVEKVYFNNNYHNRDGVLLVTFFLNSNLLENPLDDFCSLKCAMILTYK